MSNAIWAAIVADFKAGVIDLETFIQKAEAWVEQEVTGFGALVGNLISLDAQTLVADYQNDIKQIVVNIQNSTMSLTFSNFLPLFITAVLPVIESEGFKIVDEDINMIAAYFAGNYGITNTATNNGNAPSGVFTG